MRIRLSVLAVLIVTSATSAATSLRLDQLAIDHPFSTQSAIDRLQSLIKTAGLDPLSDDQVKSLTNIRRMEYVFTPAFKPDEQPRPEAVTTQITRDILISLPQLSTNTIADSIASKMSSGCEADSHLTGFRTTFSDLHRLEMTGHVHVNLWVCFLWTKTDAGHADMDFTMAMKLDPSLAATPDGPPRVYNVSKSYAWWNGNGWLSAFGPIGTGMSIVIRNEVNGAVSGAFEATRRTSANPQFAALTQGLSGISTYTSALDQGHGAVYVTPELNYDQTGFIPGTETDPIFSIVQSGSTKGRYGNAEYRKRVGEIAFLESLPQDCRSVYQVQRGDNLWKIARRFYPDPRIFLMVEDLNGKRSSKVRPGQSIALPLLWEVYERSAGPPSLVSPGDSISAIRRRRGGSLMVSASQFRSRSLNKIYPYEAVLLEGTQPPSCNDARVAMAKAALPAKM